MLVLGSDYSIVVMNSVSQIHRFSLEINHIYLWIHDSNNKSSNCDILAETTVSMVHFCNGPPEYFDLLKCDYFFG